MIIPLPSEATLAFIVGGLALAGVVIWFVVTVTRSLRRHDEILLANAAENARLQEERDETDRLRKLIESDNADAASHRRPLGQRKKRAK